MHPVVIEQKPAQGLLKAAAAFCVLFGLLFLINVHPIGDGLWYWYAQALRNGQSLYRDLHSPMQPLFFILTENFQRVLGPGWLASKVLAALQVGLYCCALYLVCSLVPWRGSRGALLLIASFGLSISASYARFDDFHVTAQLLVVFCIYTLLRLQDQVTQRDVLRYAALLGVLCGLALANRLNDGGLLLAAVGVCLLVFARTARIQAALIFTVVSFGLFLLLIFGTHSTLPMWLQSTIVQAAAIKGGTNQVFSGPFHLLYTVSVDLLVQPKLIWDVYAFIAIAGVAGYAVYFRTQPNQRLRAAVNAAAWILCIGLTLVLAQQFTTTKAVSSFADLSTDLLYLVLVVLMLRFVHLLLTGGLAGWNRREALLLIPFGQMFSGAMTSGESIQETFAPLAFFLLVLPFVFPGVVRTQPRQVAFAVTLGLLSAGTLVGKVLRPYTWNHFYDVSMFTDRTWYRHPNFGPMYIEKPQLELMQSMCGAIKSSGPDTQLLAMPWPYPNYFCNIAPWHGYIQTWYDTTSRQTVHTLMDELDTNPPEWIAYQRSFDAMYAHELVFHHGEKIPHRALDALIAAKLRSGAWSLPWQRCFGGTDWLVIHTRPAKPGEPNDELLPSSDYVNLCSRTDGSIY